MFVLLLTLFVAAVVAQEQSEQQVPARVLPYRPWIFRDIPNIEDFELAEAKNQRSSDFKLCTYTDESYGQCQALVEAATRKSIALNLQCVQRPDRATCLKAVRRSRNIIVVLGQRDYKAAREAGLRPSVFAREQPDSYYIAVAPSNISLVEYNEAHLQLNINDEDAFYAGVTLNALRQRNICPTSDSVSNGPVIRILNSAEYVPAAEDILICPFAAVAATDQAETCNFDSGLQRAVFTSPAAKRGGLRKLGQVFERILKNFNKESDFNFFENDSIFKHNTVAFDVTPTYVNGISEEIFNFLHCDLPDQQGNISQFGGDLVQVSFKDFWNGFKKGLVGGLKKGLVDGLGNGLDNL
ncbi:uncharacterized protein LOC115633981 [Scaptodrosophila lebanonensis]|uniref:Uncharacterized protein LOC115633981 n=1 Tax=Drosophila lebanonensis TaxID=7225 RepID=A0A6J2UJI1_DROLE|nr:uncharacterized protein LOC115633981 [Scaptodrosophila lebanonensis]